MRTESDLDTLNHARNGVLYGGKKNPITEWTLSDEWTNVTRTSDKQPRGLVNRAGLLVTCNQAQGEIS